jgi:hypothetical protein
VGAFLYWVEGALAPVTRAKLEDWGLGYAFTAVPHHLQSRGPGEGSGVLLADEPRLAPYLPTYRPEEQEWRKVAARHRPPGAPRLFVGVYRHAPRPTEADLRRTDVIAGESVELARGERWLVPLVRSVDVATAEAFSPLPSYVTLDDEGRPKRGSIVETHEELWEAATPFWDAWYGGVVGALEAGETSFSIHVADDVLFDSAVAMLRANYRLGPVECDLGRVFASGHLGAVMKTACDCDFAQLVLQKKTLAAAPAS